MVAAIAESTRSDADLIEALLKLLEEGIADLDAICPQLQITPDHVTELLKYTDLDEYLNTRIKLAQTAFRLRVIKLLPQAAKALEVCLACDKPEVVRRTLTIVCHLNNLATNPPKDTGKMPFGHRRR